MEERKQERKKERKKECSHPVQTLKMLRSVSTVYTVAVFTLQRNITLRQFIQHAAPLNFLEPLYNAEQYIFILLYDA